MTYTVRLEGVDHIKRLLSGDKLYRKPVQKAMKKVGQDGKPKLRGEIPRESGRMASSLGFRATYKQLLFRITAKRGDFSYPRWNEYSPKSPNRGFFKRAVDGLRSTIQSALNDAASDIEKNWKR